MIQDTCIATNTSITSDQELHFMKLHQGIAFTRNKIRREHYNTASFSFKCCMCAAFEHFCSDTSPQWDFASLEHEYLFHSDLPVSHISAFGSIAYSTSKLSSWRKNIKVWDENYTSVLLLFFYISEFNFNVIADLLTIPMKVLKFEIALFFDEINFCNTTQGHKVRIQKLKSMKINKYISLCRK